MTIRTRKIVTGVGRSSCGNPKLPRDRWMRATGVEKKGDSLQRYSRDSLMRTALANTDGGWLSWQEASLFPNMGHFGRDSILMCRFVLIVVVEEEAANGSMDTGYCTCGTGSVMFACFFSRTCIVFASRRLPAEVQINQKSNPMKLVGGWRLCFSFDLWRSVRRKYFIDALLRTIQCCTESETQISVTETHLWLSSWIRFGGWLRFPMGVNAKWLPTSGKTTKSDLHLLARETLKVFNTSKQSINRRTESQERSDATEE